MRKESKELVDALIATKEFPNYFEGELAGETDFKGFKFPFAYNTTDIIVDSDPEETISVNKTFYKMSAYHGGGDGTVDKDWSDSLGNAGVSWSYHNVGIVLMNSSYKHYAETTCTATANGTVNWSASDYYKVYSYNYVNIISHGLLYIKKNDEFVVEALDLGTTEGLNSSSGSIDIVVGDVITAYFMGAGSNIGINSGSFIDLEMKCIDNVFTNTQTTPHIEIREKKKILISIKNTIFMK